MNRRNPKFETTLDFACKYPSDEEKPMLKIKLFNLILENSGIETAKYALAKNLEDKPMVNRRLAKQHFTGFHFGRRYRKDELKLAERTRVPNSQVTLFKISAKKKTMLKDCVQK